uniref:heat stress transcription factor A-5-like n=1 Tax=Erigeron canadensis TaxID=72917 RepID=UPI001CB98E60|nr:heat stress transcription factor A-5-like [Erigeron canadensis]
MKSLKVSQLPPYLLPFRGLPNRRAHTHNTNPMAEKPTTGGGAGPAPFLLKTYEMVDDALSDAIVSWSSTSNSFVVWNPPEFARLLLPTYFKHNNFSSFIRQLNTYGFRKIDPERWEFANEDFVKDQKHRLKNIQRKKPIHSHSNPQGSTIDPERVAFEEEINKLTQEKIELEKSLSRFKQQQPLTEAQLEDLTQQVDGIEQRQNHLLMYLKKAVQTPGFADLLSQKLESIDLSAYNKKRRLPVDDKSQVILDDGVLVDNRSLSRPQFGNVFNHESAYKIRLELSSAVSDSNMVSHSTQSSNGDVGSPQVRFSEGCIRDDVQMTSGGLPLAAEQLEVSDTGASFTFNMDSSFAHKSGPCEIPSCLSIDEEAEGHISSLLNLSLASGLSQVNASQGTGRIAQSIEEIGKPSYFSIDKHNEAGLNVPKSNRTLLSTEVPPANNQVPTPPVNDVFWEQFLTEKPGSSDLQVASSRATGSYEQEDQGTAHGPH